MVTACGLKRAVLKTVAIRVLDHGPAQRAVGAVLVAFRCGNRPAQYARYLSPLNKHRDHCSKVT
jgi:hypothetical protein